MSLSPASSADLPPSKMSSSAVSGLLSAEQAQIEVASDCCYHCGELLQSQVLYTSILGQPRPMCCTGCQVASESIVEAGLESYYLDRTEVSRTAPLPEQLDHLSGYDHDEIKQEFVFIEDGFACAELSVVGLKCTACAWLIEKRLYQQPGVQRVNVNLGTHRMRVIWDEEATPVSQLISQVEHLGYTARPFRQDTHGELLKKQSKAMLFRLAVAGLGMMQAMTFAAAVYFGNYYGMELQYKHFFQWVGLLVTIPVFFYAGMPFYQSAWTALKNKTLNMDVPVSIALILTFSASTYAALSQSGETYFDSISMFIFFLLAGRFLEHKAREKATQTAHDLILIEPWLVHRQRKDDTGQVIREDIPAHLLQKGDIVLVRAGESIPCDGVVVEGSGFVSEALLTGESQPLEKTVGSELIGGSQNYAQPLLMEVTNPPQVSQKALLDRLMNRALAERPRAVQQADKMAKWFVARVLVLAAVVYAGWFYFDPHQAFWATLAVLVATCPCALSLATPMALTIATNRLAGLGFILTRGHVLETMAQATHYLFDKTGTLTKGCPVLQQTTVLGDLTKAQVLAIASTLEQTSNHPIAVAFRMAFPIGHLPENVEIRHVDGEGIEGDIDGITYRLGHAGFIGLAVKDQELVIYLARKGGLNYEPLASFVFIDQIRPEAYETVKKLQQSGAEVWMISGDPSAQPEEVGRQLGLNKVYGGLLPEKKVKVVRQLQEAGHKVVMVGDGVNDGPVLATANVSVAMSSGSDLAHLSADSIVLNDSLKSIIDAQRVSRRTFKIIGQNLKWAFGYNFIILFPAALGYVPPWLAAIGMTTSSLMVIFNAMRLNRS